MFPVACMVDRKKLKNPNGLILGTPGSGKSFSAKREICNAFLVTDDDIIICDPECEYAPLVERLHGQVIHISPASTQYINPMDINSNYSEEDNPLALKADFVLSLCELVVGGKEGLQPVEKTVIDRCVHVIYRKYFENPTPENMPLLEDLYNALLTQDEPEARHVAAALEIYVKGSLNIFNHHTNVDIIVWNGLIVDGHNRYAILQKHPDIPYTVHEKEFADRYEAIIWICKNQLGRRNLTPEQKKYLAGIRYQSEKKKDGGNGNNQHGVFSKEELDKNCQVPPNESTRKRLAKELNVSEGYIQFAESFSKGVDAAEEISPGSRQKILSGTVKGTAKDVMALARTPPEERPALVERICIPKEPKKSTGKSASKSKKKAQNLQTTAVEELPRKTETAPAGIDDPPKPTKTLTELQTIRALSNKMESVEQVADAEGMLSEVESAADMMIYRLDVCFEHYPDFLKNPNIRQRVVELLQKAKDYIVKLEGEFAYD